MQEDQLLPVVLHHGGENRQMPVVRHQTRRVQARPESRRLAKVVQKCKTSSKKTRMELPCLHTRWKSSHVQCGTNQRHIQGTNFGFGKFSFDMQYLISSDSESVGLGLPYAALGAMGCGSSKQQVTHKQFIKTFRSFSNVF
jgi:hypothetical protein